jgi:catechol 2,3-dioxygenase-like lactoylglutathione lyase family enzyme
MRTRLDHIVIAATDMERGVTWAEKKLGVRVPRGGVHETMGTRNHVMRIGEEMFLEIIAITPDGPVPAKPRWFGLDDPAVRERLDRSPAFLAWVANTDDLDAFLDAAPVSFGRATPVSRGELNWRFALPSDGRLLAAGMLPYAIQYPEWLGSILDSVGPVESVEVHPLPPMELPRMAARIDTPEGVRLLETLPGACGCPPSGG